LSSGGPSFISRREIQTRAAARLREFILFTRSTKT